MYLWAKFCDYRTVPEDMPVISNLAPTHPPALCILFCKISFLFRYHKESD